MWSHGHLVYPIIGHLVYPIICHVNQVSGFFFVSPFPASASCNPSSKGRGSYCLTSVSLYLQSVSDFPLSDLFVSFKPFQSLTLAYLFFWLTVSDSSLILCSFQTELSLFSMCVWCLPAFIFLHKLLTVWKVYTQKSPQSLGLVNYLLADVYFSEYLIDATSSEEPFFPYIITCN